MLKFFFLFAAVYLLLGLYFYRQQRNMIYFPRAEVSHPFREFAVENQDESIYVIAVNEGKDEAIIYFGGNAEAAGKSAQTYAEHFTEQTLYCKFHSHPSTYFTLTFPPVSQTSFRSFHFYPSTFGGFCEMNYEK